MKRILVIILMIALLCTGCKKEKNNVEDSKTNTSEDVDNEIEDDKNDQSEEENQLPVELNIAENEYYYIGEDDMEYGFGRILFFDKNMKVVKYFENAVIPGHDMGVIDINEPIIVGLLNEEKRDGATNVEPSHYTYGLYDLAKDNWIIPMEYDSITLYANNDYGAYLTDSELETTKMILYNKSGAVLNSGIDVTNSYIVALGEYLWNISYDANGSSIIFNKDGSVKTTIATCNGMVHGDFFIASKEQDNDIIYNAAGEPYITKDLVVKNSKLANVANDKFFVVSYNDYSQLMEIQLGTYNLVIDKDGDVLCIVDQKMYPNRMAIVDYWLYYISDYSDDNMKVSYYDLQGKHLLTTSNQEFQGHLEPFGLDFTPHALYYQTITGFEVYDYIEKETYHFNIGQVGEAMLQSPLQDFYVITNNLETETQTSVFYKNQLLYQGANIVAEVRNGYLVVSELSEDYQLEGISHIYDSSGNAIYNSPDYEIIEIIGNPYIQAKRDGVRTIVDYNGNVVYSFDQDYDIPEEETP
ncbi:MAG TPA: hypothetical protein VHP81_11255 [Lachnospiraceae bacterium]|nr:hypothetical protein [Lachnospiraceae bacterium]